MSLKGLNQFRQSQEKTGGKFLRLKDGDAFKIRPLQELDQDSKNFSTKNGVAVFTKEWENPSNFRQVILDTMDEEGRCVGQEQSSAEGGWEAGWRPKNRMYLNVLVDRGDGSEPTVELLQANMAPKAVQSNQLIECHTNNGSVTNRWWKYSRKGAGQFDTTYSLNPLDGDPKDKFDAEAYDLIDIDSVLPKVPYENQRAALGLNVPQAAAAEATSAPASASSISAEW